MDSKKLTQEELDERIAEIRRKNAERDRKRALVEEDKRKAEENNASVTLKSPSINEKRDPNYKPTLYCDKIDLTEGENQDDESAASHQEDIEGKSSRKNANENVRSDKMKHRYPEANVPKWRRKPVDDTKWREERKKIDEDRIKRHRNKEGEWRREWDVHKDMDAPSTQSALADSNRNAFNNDKSYRYSQGHNRQIENDSYQSEMSGHTRGISKECENNVKSETSRRPGNEENWHKNSSETPRSDSKRECADRRPMRGPSQESNVQRERYSNTAMKEPLENKDFQDKNSYEVLRSDQKREQADLRPMHGPSHECNYQPERHVPIKKEKSPFRDKNNYGVRHIDQKREHVIPPPIHEPSCERHENIGKERHQKKDPRDKKSYRAPHSGQKDECASDLVPELSNKSRNKYKENAKSETSVRPRKEISCYEAPRSDQICDYVDPRTSAGSSYKSSDKSGRDVKIEMEQLLDDEIICDETIPDEWVAESGHSQELVHFESDQSLRGGVRKTKAALPSIPEENFDGRGNEDHALLEMKMPELPRFPENNQARVRYSNEMNIPPLPSYPEGSKNWPGNRNQPIYYVQPLPSYPEDINWQQNKHPIPYMLPPLPRYPEPNTNWQPNTGQVPYFNPPLPSYPEGSSSWHPGKGQVPYILPQLPPRYPEKNTNWQPNNGQVPYLMSQFPSFPVENTSWPQNRDQLSYLISQFPKYPELPDSQENNGPVPYEAQNPPLPSYPEENIHSEGNEGGEPSFNERSHPNMEESIQRTVKFEDDVKKKAFVVNFNNNTEETKSNRVNLRDQIYGGSNPRVKFTSEEVKNAEYRDTLNVYPDLAVEDNVPNLYAKSILNDSDVEKNYVNVHLTDEATHRRRSTLTGENSIKVEFSVDDEKAGPCASASFRSVFHSVTNTYKAPSGTLNEKFSDQ